MIVNPVSMQAHIAQSIRKMVTVANKNMDKFAKLWPDTLSTRAPARDLDYEADVTLPRMVASVCSSSSAPLRSSAARIASFPTSRLNGSA